MASANLAILVAEHSARLARLEAAHTTLDPNELISVKQAAAELRIQLDACFKRINRHAVRKYPVPGSSRRYRVRRGDLIGGGL